MVIARFLRYADRERIMRNTFKLKNTDFTIYDDIPKELIASQRADCQPFMKLGKQERGWLLASPNQINYLLMANLSLRYDY